jgi:hypothetical protein
MRQPSSIDSVVYDSLTDVGYCGEHLWDEESGVPTLRKARRVGQPWLGLWGYKRWASALYPYVKTGFW